MLKEESVMRYKKSMRKSTHISNKRFLKNTFNRIKESIKYFETYFNHTLSGENFKFENIDGEDHLIIEFEDLKIWVGSPIDNSKYDYMKLIQTCSRAGCNNLIIGESISGWFDIGRIFTRDPSGEGYQNCITCKNYLYQNKYHEYEESRSERLVRELGDLLREIIGDEEY